MRIGIAADVFFRLILDLSFFRANTEKAMFQYLDEMRYVDNRQNKQRVGLIINR